MMGMPFFRSLRGRFERRLVFNSLRTNLQSMAYRLIQPPPPYGPFRERSQDELKDYFRWFFAVMDERINELIPAVRATSGFQIWRPDYSPASLDSLGDWFVGQVETRPRTQEEINKIAEALKFPVLIPISERTLSERTLSLTIDVAMYFGRVLQKNNPSLKWDQRLRGKGFADYGQTVLMGFGAGVPLNPVRLVRTTALSVMASNPRGKSLRGFYDHWIQKIPLTS
jgi:hypothetical protein